MSCNQAADKPEPNPSICLGFIMTISQQLLFSTEVLLADLPPQKKESTGLKEQAQERKKQLLP